MSSDVLLRLHATGTYSQCDSNDERFKWESLKTRRNNQRLTMFYRICNITWCLLLQLIILFRFCGGTAEDRVMTKCIKFLTLGPISTSTLSSQQQLYACGTLYLHLWSILSHFSPSKQASVFITDTDSRDHRHQCVILGFIEGCNLLEDEDEEDMR